MAVLQIYLHHLYLLPSFSPARRSVIARNTLDILMLHKRFTKALVSILEEEGIFDGQSDVEEQNLVGATRRIAAEFVQEVCTLLLHFRFFFLSGYLRSNC
jgi:hypothetical protein